MEARNPIGYVEQELSAENEKSTPPHRWRAFGRGRTCHRHRSERAATGLPQPGVMDSAALAMVWVAMAPAAQGLAVTGPG